MLDTLRTLLANFIVSHFTRPQLLLVQAWLWLAAKPEDLEDKRRCLKAVLELDPENEPATLALLVLDQKRPDN